MPLDGVRTGYVETADGVVSPYSRASRVNALVMAQGQGKYYEATSRGNVFSANLAAWSSTIAAGNINGAAAAASTQFAVWNPPNSNKNLSILKFMVWPISGTSPIPPVFHSYSRTAPTIASTAGAIVCNNPAKAGSSSIAGCLASAAGSALTGSTALVIIRAADLYITAGTAANLGGFKCVEYVDGDIVIAPGSCWVPTWVAAGTTFLGGYSVTWEEIPI